jgi:hypothetical protein
MDKRSARDAAVTVTAGPDQDGDDDDQADAATMSNRSAPPHATVTPTSRR